MLCPVPANSRSKTPVLVVVTAVACFLASMVIPAFGQTPVNAGPDIRDRLPEIVDVRLFKQARYAGSAILIHLPTNKARALIMPEPVTLKGEQAQMPGLELAYAGDVIGFFATRNFTRRPVSFIGADSGIEYRLQIRASQDGITEPLKIVR